MTSPNDNFSSRKLLVSLFVVGVIFFGLSQVDAVEMPGNSVWNNSGNVGVGTTNPLSNFDIGGWNPGTLSISSGGSKDLLIQGSSGSNIINSLRTNNLYFQTNGTTRVTLQGASGNVGIGTTAPSYNLDVNGTVHATKLYGDGSGLTNVSASTLPTLGNGLNAETNREVKASGVYMYSTYNGGTGAPDTYNQIITWGNGSSEIQISGDWVNANYTPLYVRSLRDCCQSWSPWTRILTSGTDPYPSNMNQYVRTTDSPTFAALTINGNLNANGGLKQDGNTILNGTDTWLRTTGATGWYSSTYGGGWYMSDSTWIQAYNNKYVKANYFYSNGEGAYLTGGSGTSGYIPKWNGTYTQINSQIYDNGTNVGIGTTAPGYKLDVNGGVRGTEFVYSSDRALKNNIKDLTPSESLANIQKLQGVSFNWKSNGEHQVGLIAQDVQKVYPELVHGQPGNMGVQYGNLVAPLIEAVKAQQTEIKELQSISKSLQAKNADLQHQIDKLRGE